MFIMFLLLGVCGFITVLGLFGKRRWGLQATLLVIAANIVFDVWGLTVQFTAAIGFIVPAISITYLFFKRRGYT